MSFVPTVFVHEFFTGGGFPEGNLPAGLAEEALGMLWALLMDFRRWGAVRTVTILDPRFEERVPGLNRKTLPANEVLCALPGKHEEIRLSQLKRSDALLVVAPETGGILAKLTAEAEKFGIPLLNSCASAAAVAGDKAACSRLFHSAKLPAPKTRSASFLSARRAAEQLGCPLVVKPLDGVGSEGVCRVDSLADLPGAVAIVRRATSHRQILLQSYASGTHASASLLMAKGNNCLPLSLNLQLVDEGSPFRYRGSQVPFDHPAADYALELAGKAAKLIPGLKGYIGVDLVLTNDGAQLIEINPRLTTSYIALRQVAQINLAQAIWQACLKGVLPDHVPLTGQATIAKDDARSWDL